jgi:hypothetical protein
MRQKLILIGLTVLVLTMIVAAGSRFSFVTHAESSSAGTFGIEGGWLVTVTPPAGSPGPASFKALDSFSAGGGYSGRSSTDAATNFSPAYGTWRRTDEEEGIVVTQAQFSHDPSGNPTGTVIVHRQMHSTSPDTLEGTSQISFCDLNGNNCFSPPGHAVVSAIRIKAAGPVQ